MEPVTEEDMTLLEIAKLSGVRDLPVTVRAPFARALKKEIAGDHEGAAEALDKAVLAEAKLATAGTD